MPQSVCRATDVLVSYWCTYMYVTAHSNAQRPSAITGMTATELKQGLESRTLGKTDRAIFMVKHHKTGQSHPQILSDIPPLLTDKTASAILVADNVTVKMLVLWQRLLSRVLESDLAFPEFDGTILTHLERKVERAAKALPAHSNSVPKRSGNTKQTAGRTNTRRISRSMSHSQGTSATYYQAPTSKDSYVTYQTIVALIDGERGKSPTPEVSEEEDRVAARVSKRKKRTYDDEEDEEEDENGQAVLLREKGKGKTGVPTKGAGVPIS